MGGVKAVDPLLGGRERDAVPGLAGLDRQRDREVRLAGARRPEEADVAVLGDPPKRVGVTEFESLDKAQAWINSPERKGLAPQREKAVKFIRQYIVEGK